MAGKKKKYINCYPRHDDYGEIAKKAEEVFNWWYEENKSIIEEPMMIELNERILYGRD